MLISLLCASSALSPVSTAATGTAADLLDKDAIVVTASPIAKPADELLASASVLDSEELQRQLRATLGETLRREPGVSSTGFGPGASRPIIRGLGGQRVRTLTNGIGSIDAAAESPDHAVPIEPVLAERIEVVRGAQLLRYGSSAAGGVINVFDNRITSEAPEDGFNLSARTAWTTVDEGQEAALAGQVLLGQWGGIDVVATAAASFRNAEDYDIPGFAESAAFRAAEEDEDHDDHDEHDHDDDHDHDDEETRGTLENSFLDAQTYSGGLSFIGDRGFFGFSVQRYETEYGIPAGHDHAHGHEDEDHEGDHDEDDDHDHDEEDGVFIDLEQTRFDINASLNTQGFIQRLDLFAGYAEYEHTEFEGPGEVGTVFANDGVEVRFEAIQQDRGAWRGASGIQYRGREFSAIGEEAFIDPTETDQVGLYTFQELRFDRSSVEAALRYESTDHDELVEDIQLSYDTFSASLGGSLRPADDITLVANLFRTERAPTTEELFSDGPHLATQSFDLGDASLDTETALGIELGVRLDWDWLRLGFTGFHTDYQDFIYRRSTGQTGADILLAQGETDEEELEEFGELIAVQYTASDATFTGFEFEAEADLVTWRDIDLTADLVVDYVNASLQDNDPTTSDELPRIPPLGLIAGLEANAAYGSLRAEVEYADEADSVAAFELPTEEFTLVNLYATWRIRNQLSFEVSGLNLFDEEARLHTSFIKDEVPLPGRNFRFALRYTY